MCDKFLLNQKLLSLNAKYYVYDEGGRHLFYVDRPVFKMKIDIGVYNDENKRQKFFSLKTHKVFMFPNLEYYFYDENDNLLAVFVKNSLAGILRGKWDIFTDEAMTQHLGYAEEDSWGKALFRRFAPFGEFLKTDFHIYMQNKQVGTFNRKWTIEDKYVMDLSLDPHRNFDRRIALGLALVLDIGEQR